MSTNDLADPEEPKPKRRRVALVAGVAAAVLVLGGGVTTLVTVNAYRAETVRLCEAAVASFTKAATGPAKESLTAADAVLAASADEAIQKEVPGAGKYSERPEVKADAEKKVEARKAGATLVQDVLGAQKVVKDAGVKASCEDRDTAAALETQTKDLTKSVASLDAAAEVLVADVTDFKESEAKRIAAEKAAAEQAAAEQAAREEAARIAAEQAAAEQAAAEQQWVGGGGGWAPPQNDGYVPPGGGGGYQPPAGGGGGSYTPPRDPNGIDGCPPGVNCAV